MEATELTMMPCPECGLELPAADYAGQVKHMNQEHRDVVEQRMADAGMSAHEIEGAMRQTDAVQECLELAQWLVSLDEPDSAERKTVTLTQIINRAQAALKGESDG